MERLHKVSAGFVFAFLCLHFANHFVGLLGVDAHQQFIEAARLVYRHPVVEMVVLLAFFVQILTGVPLILEIWRKKKDFIPSASGRVGPDHGDLYPHPRLLDSGGAPDL